MRSKEYKFMKYKYNNLKISGRYINVIVNGVFIFPNAIMFIDDIIHFMFDKEIISMINYRDVVGLEIKVSDVDEIDEVSGDDIISYDGTFITCYTKY